MSDLTPTRYSGFIGRTEDGDRVFVTIVLRHREGPAQTTTHDMIDYYAELSITGEVYAAGRALTGDVIGAGQIMEEVARVAEFGEIADGLDHAALVALVGLWDRWHLNGMRAGCAHQTVVWENSSYGRRPSLDLTPECPAVVLSDMPVTAEDYRPAYRYGSGWLVEVIPAAVLAEIHALGARIAEVDADEAEDEVETITYDEAADRFAEMLDDCHDEIQIGYATFGAGEVLRRMAPDMFAQGVDDWAANEGVEVGAGPDDDE